MNEDLTLIVHKSKNQTPELLPVLKVYECGLPDAKGQRVHTLLVAAAHVQEASELIFAKTGWRHYTIVEMERVYAVGSPRILYNDEEE